MRKVIYLSLLLSSTVFAQYNIAIPELEVNKKVIEAPLVIYTQKTSANADANSIFGSYASNYKNDITLTVREKLSNSDQLNNLTIQNLGMLITSIRASVGKISNVSIIDAKKYDLAKTGNIYAIAHNTLDKIKSAKPDPNAPRYWLVTSLASIDASENDPTELMDTNRFTTSLGLDVMVSFYLIDGTTNKIVDSYVLEANSGDTKILNTPTQKVTYNYNRIIKEVFDSLSEQAASRVEDSLANLKPTTHE